MNKLPEKYNGVVEQLIRPTGLLDPVVSLRPSEARLKDELVSSLKRRKFESFAKELEDSNVANQIDDIISQTQGVTKKAQRVLITTLTKRMAEDLSSYLKELGIKVQYLHSEIDTVERVEILRDLRLGKYDVIVGINLLREGIDLPEVSLVAILDADKEGFLRSRTSLLQTMGRAARHEEGRVVLYADKVTDSMSEAMRETMRRREHQDKYNKKHNITPRGIKKEIKDQLKRSEEERDDLQSKSLTKKAERYVTMNKKERSEFVKDLEVQMTVFADMLEFEKAAEIRDILDDIKNK